MSRGKKLDLFIGAKIDNEWSETTEQKNDAVQENITPKKHSLVFKKEKRRGKVVTLVGEFFIPSEDANSTLKLLKKKLACGGTYKEGWMEFQGDVWERLKQELQALNFRFKR
jgi:translation initiation factor 1